MQAHHAYYQRHDPSTYYAYIALFFKWAHLAADSFTPLERARREHRAPSAWADDPGTTLIVSGSMSLIFGLAAVERIEASFTRKSRPYSSLREFHRHRLPAAAGRCCAS